jgi:outer membrane protein OmpA-like peptidoglycan-associated protein
MLGEMRPDDSAGRAKPDVREATPSNDEAAPPKRKHRGDTETKEPALTPSTPEKAGAEELGKSRKDQRKEQRKERNARRGGEDKGDAASDTTLQPKPGLAEPKTEGKAGRQPDNADAIKPDDRKTGEADHDKRRGDKARNAEGGQTGKQPGGDNAQTGETAPKPGERPKRPDDNNDNAGNGNVGKPAMEQSGKDRDRSGEKAKNATGEEAPDANSRAAKGDSGAEAGGNVVLPRSLNGQRPGEGRKRERRNAGDDKAHADDAGLPDSARGPHGQRKEGPRGGKAGPLPDSDAAAQADFKRPSRIESITTIEGKRVDKPERFDRDRPRDVKVVKEIDNRTIVEFNNQVFVRGSDRPRLGHGARDVYYEDLPRNRTREVIERPDGSRVITIRNEYGDVIRRSRILPDHREIVLVYVDDRDLDRDRDRGWGDAGADLPPLVVDVPRDDYVLEADDVRDPNRYYDFLEQPPVEPVRRLYSLGEVKRSARIRDIMPRIDLDTITFDFGSPKVGEDQADKLQAVADALKKILDNNPAETFLIEGHTDAVGSDQANLVLSDQRADSVASLLTSMFDIPAENLTTQGYGEEYLKVDTQEANRQNRRVTIRRITPLVAPVASAQ